MYSVKGADSERKASPELSSGHPLQALRGAAATKTTPRTAVTTCSARPNNKKVARKSEKPSR